MLEMERRLVQRERRNDEEREGARAVLREHPEARCVLNWPWWLVTENGGITGILGKGSTRERAWEDAAERLR